MDEIGAGPKVSPARRYGLRDVLFAVYVGVCLMANGWPLYAWLGNSVEPYVLGLPFSLAWIVGWVLASFVVLVAYHATGPEDAE